MLTGFVIPRHKLKQIWIISCAMDDTMNPNRLSLNGVEYEIIFNNKEPVSHTPETLFVWDFPRWG